MCVIGPLVRRAESEVRFAPPSGLVVLNVSSSLFDPWAERRLPKKKRKAPAGDIGGDGTPEAFPGVMISQQ
jgi:hypothetical protein